ncbi:MAG: CHASE2 domain-containing protein [Candidatus Competibacteraceae bacterium]|nr:CHASE2 domain-containing protein [Candidatus Competibacteraceae bacterium]
MRKAQRLRAFLLEKPVLLSFVLAVFAVLLVYSDVLWRWNGLLYDWNLRYWWRSPPEDVVIVAIDEYSLDQIGRWPWPRQTHAAVVDRLTTVGAKAIALDIILPNRAQLIPVLMNAWHKLFKTVDELFCRYCLSNATLTVR